MAERGLNIQNVKDKTTLSRTTISNLYNNIGSGIQFGTLRELCELLKCQPGDLLTYIEIDPNFKALTEDPEISIEKSTSIDEDGNSHEYTSSIKTKIKCNCSLKYEGTSNEFIFFVEVKFGLDENKEIDNMDIGISPHFEFTLSHLKMPPYAEGYMKDKLEYFLIDWAYNSAYSSEIEGTTAMLLNYYLLLD